MKSLVATSLVVAMSACGRGPAANSAAGANSAANTNSAASANSAPGANSAAGVNSAGANSAVGASSAAGANAAAAGSPAGNSAVTGGPAGKARLFEFHSQFWVNLHQSLHYAAMARRPAPAWAPRAPSGPAWAAAVAYYKERFGAAGGMGVIFDAELVALNRSLSALGSTAKLTGIERALAGHLEAAAELVRDRWPEQDRVNRRWVAALEAVLAVHGEAMRAELVAILGVPWPEEPVRVDVACVAGPVGAYTVGEPGHITISTCDPGYAGEGALEMIFHEASHPLIGRVERAIDEEAARLGRPAPRNLWHAVLFYTAGELTRRRLGPGYVPYAEKSGLWGGRMGEVEPLRREWQPYLEGRRGLEEAIRALVSASSR